MLRYLCLIVYKQSMSVVNNYYFASNVDHKQAPAQEEQVAQLGVVGIDFGDNS